MSNINVCFHAVALRVTCLSMCLSLCTVGVIGQVAAKSTMQTGSKVNVEDAIAKVKSGEFALVTVEVIAEAGATRAVPILENQFALSQNPIAKLKLANALVRLGDTDDKYWEFLVAQATPVVESDAPDFVGYDSHGKSMGGPSPEFVAWAASHKQLPSDKLMAEDPIYLPSVKVISLASTNDPRAIPLLRRALGSPNHQIEIVGALGLAGLSDFGSIPAIIEACKSSPEEVAAVMAKSLVYFEDPAAQRAVDLYAPAGTAKLYRDAKARGVRPFGQKAPTQ